MKPHEYTRLPHNKKIIQCTVYLCNLAAFILLILPSNLSADYLWPLKDKSHLTGAFGEFRKTHIHAGIDISTQGRIGLPVYAGESGYLYRVKTQYIGFGRAVYLRLSDGRFLVYAHLDRFSSKIEKVIKTAQLKQKKFAVDVYPKSKIYIEKGGLIGYSGDTGGVSPHLHLELRDAEERPLNILKNGLAVPDKTPPLIRGLAVCNPDNTLVISEKNTSPITISGKAGLAVSIYDESSGNKLGIYQIDLIIDGKLFFRVKMDSFSYDEFYDNFLVYNKDLYIKRNKIYYHLFRAFDNLLPFYPLNTDGILNLTPGRHSITIKAVDNQGNTSTLNIVAISKPGRKLPKKKLKTGPWYSDDGKFCLKLEGLYHPVDIKIKTLPAEPVSQGLEPLSKVYEVSPKETVFKKAHITMQIPRNSEKTALYRFEGGKWKYIKDNTCRALGRFCLFKDRTPPEIRIISPMKARIEDKGSGLDYGKLALYINGRKVIAEYSINKKELFHKEQLPPGRCKIMWIASDRAGNQAKKKRIYGR